MPHGQQHGHWNEPEEGPQGRLGRLAALVAATRIDIAGLRELVEKIVHRPGRSLGLHVAAVTGRSLRMKVPPIELVDVEKVKLSIAPKDEDGRDISAPTASWSSSDTSVITLEVAADTLSAEAISGAPGTATVSVTAGALSDQIDITVKVGAPASLNLSAGVPEHE